MISTNAQQGKPDVLLLPIYELETLRNSQLLQKYESPEAKYLDKNVDDAEGYYYKYCSEIYVLAFNSNLIQRKDVPRRYRNLLVEKWHSRLAHLDPRCDEGTMWLATMTPILGESFLRELAGQDLLLSPTQTELLSSVSTGDRPLGMIASLRKVLAARARGSPIDFIMISPAYTVPIGVAITKDASSPNSAKLWVNFILSEEGQKLLASNGWIPNRRGVPSKLKSEETELINCIPHVDISSARKDAARLYGLE